MLVIVGWEGHTYYNKIHVVYYHLVTIKCTGSRAKHTLCYSVSFSVSMFQWLPLSFFFFDGITNHGTPLKLRKIEELTFYRTRGLGFGWIGSIWTPLDFQIFFGGPISPIQFQIMDGYFQKTTSLWPSPLDTESNWDQRPKEGSFLISSSSSPAAPKVSIVSHLLYLFGVHTVIRLTLLFGIREKKKKRSKKQPIFLGFVFVF